MAIRVRRPATTRLDLSQGDYLIVKQDLTAGEARDLVRASTHRVMMPAAGGPAPQLELDPVANSVAMVVAYLIDWSFQDADGKKIEIAGQPANVLRTALDYIDVEAFKEVSEAILHHQEARSAALDEEKKTRPGLTESDRTLVSVG